MARIVLVALALALAGCTKAGEAPTPEGAVERAGSLPVATPGRRAPDAHAEGAVEAPAPAPTVVMAATLTRVGETPGPLTVALAFGEGDRWWHWDGLQALEYRGASPEGVSLDAEGLLAIAPKAAPGRPLVVGSSLVTHDGVRALPDAIVHALWEQVSPYGGFEISEVAWAPDARQVVIARHWRPGRCCREREHRPPPRTAVVEVHDVARGTKVELPGGAPLAIGADRLLVADTLYERAPLHPLDVMGGPSSPRAVAIDATGALVAWEGHDGTLQLLRSDDGRPLRSWRGPELGGVLAFHPRHPLLAVASPERLELWRVDLEEPKRIAEEPLSQTPSAIVFDPEGRRLLVTGMRGVVLDLVLMQVPAGPEPSALQRDLEAPPPAALAWQVGRDVDAVGVGEQRVYAYGRGRGLVGFDRRSGDRVGSWRRNHDDYRGVAAASRAPIFAVVEDRWGRDPEARTQRLELLDASKWVVVGTRWPKLGQIDELVLSARGTSVAWALEDDPIVTLESVEGGGGWLQLHANSNDVEAIAISDDDTRLAVANRHVERNVFVGTVGSEDVETITTPRGVTHLSFSPDGTRLYVADFDGRVHVVDLGRAEVIATLEPGLQSINAMAVTADGTRLVVAYQEVVVLEIATGAEVRRFGGAPAMDYLRSVAVSEDGTVIVAGTASGVVRRFELR